MAITRLSGGLTPANGADPRTFSAVWNGTADDLEAGEYSRVPQGGSAGEVLVKQSATDYDSDWELPQWSWALRSGSYYGPQYHSITTAALPTQRVTAVPAFVPRPTAFDRLACRITSAGSAGSTVRFGIYSNGANGPDALVHDLGTIDGSATGNPVELTIDVTLSGFFWIAYRPNNISAPTVSVGGPVAWWMPGNSAMAQVQGAAQEAGDAGVVDALPATFTYSNVPAAGAIIRLRVA
jgi:hypothetical protein